MANKNLSILQNMQKTISDKGDILANPDLTALDTKTKDIYLKMLCSTLQDEPTEKQNAFLKSIFNGINTDNQIGETIKHSKNLSEDDVNEFVSVMKNNKVRYYFFTEAFILSIYGCNDKECLEYIYGLITLCGMTEKDKKYTSLIAQSVTSRDSSSFEEADKYSPDIKSELSWFPYIKDYFVGKISYDYCNNHYYAPSLDMEKELSLKNDYSNEDKLVFENLIINLPTNTTFTDCGEVIFKNCRFCNAFTSKADDCSSLLGVLMSITGVESHMQFSKSGNVSFINCSFTGFTDRVAVFEDVDSFTSVGCTYDTCSTSSDSDSGGVFLFTSEDEDGYLLSSFVLKDNTVLNCHCDDSCFGIFACVDGGFSKAEITGNKFMKCTGSDDLIHTASACSSLIEENNSITGCGKAELLS